ncbi:MAG TPA: hypothetical protein VIL00_00245 [Pseudonocardiaceae bacterium]
MGGVNGHRFPGRDNYSSMSLGQLRELLGDAPTASTQKLVADLQTHVWRVAELADRVSRLAEQLAECWPPGSPDREHTGGSLRAFAEAQRRMVRDLGAPFLAFVATARSVAEQVRTLEDEVPSWPDVVPSDGLPPTALTVIRIDQARHEQALEARRQQAIELGRRLDSAAQVTETAPRFAPPPVPPVLGVGDGHGTGGRRATGSG